MGSFEPAKALSRHRRLAPSLIPTIPKKTSPPFSHHQSIYPSAKTPPSLDFKPSIRLSPPFFSYGMEFAAAEKTPPLLSLILRLNASLCFAADSPPFIQKTTTTNEQGSPLPFILRFALRFAVRFAKSGQHGTGDGGLNLRLASCVLRLAS